MSNNDFKVVATDPIDPDEAFLASIRLDPAQIEAVVKFRLPCSAANQGATSLCGCIRRCS